jgi:uncharacterized membrane protein YciS (DUF1049 family)
MHAVVKILLGLVFIAIGLGLFVDSVTPIFGTTGTWGIDWLTNFIIVLTGTIPALLILLGLFVVWLEIDEVKAEREIKAEEKKVEEEKPKSKPKAKKK